MKVDCDVIVIGAGAAGLMAAMTLGKAGKKVILLEAGNRTGGRIHTIHDKNFSAPVELGAEFIHGNLPVTLALLKEAGIKRIETGGSFWNASGGKLTKGFGFMRGWDILEKHLTELKEDISLDDFLIKYFTGDEFVSLRNSVRGFAEGYDATDTKRFSTFAFREEWLSENDEAQYRIKGGYGSLISYMENECRKAKVEIHLSHKVMGVKWGPGMARVGSGPFYLTNKLIITTSAGILQDKRNSIRFGPRIDDKLQEINSIGFGNAMKVILQFDNTFWQSEDFVKRFGKEINSLGFIISDAPIPTWWTQAPESHSMLVGWCGGGRADKFNNKSDEEILQAAIDSLAQIFSVESSFLKTKLKAHYTMNWANQPFAKGAYTYTTVEEAKVKKTLYEPVNGTIYFAGEAFYDGPYMGTVEAALSSGKRVAEDILKV